MKLDSRQSGVSLPLRLHSLNWSSKPDLSTTKLHEQASTWVQLKEPPSPYSHDEALLLCQHSETEWVAWIPEYGEIILHQSQFG
ncbi:MAG TPA: hypothetical protein V6D14_20110 [Coleofasciculaceae cyanobacterium]